jgi:hypothetical protein
MPGVRKKTLARVLFESEARVSDGLHPIDSAHCFLLGPLMELDNRTRYGKVWKKGVGSSPPPGEASGNRVTPPSPLA